LISKKPKGIQMRTILIVGFLFLFVFSGQVSAEPLAKHLIDAEPGKALLFDAEKWFQEHPIEKGIARAETVFKSPRVQVMFFRFKGAPLGRHIHTQVDELVYVVKGRGEQYINGKWLPIKAGDFHTSRLPIKAGDFHTSPRGVAHGGRTAGDEELWMILFFTEPLQPGGDRAMIE
jgi:quercetin dioxygenase-like cupin family protein